MARSSQKLLGAALLIVGLLLEIDPLTIILGIPIILGGVYFLLRKRR